MGTMNISLPGQLMAFVEDQVAEKGYGTSSEYVCDLIRKERDRQNLRKIVLEGAGSAQSDPADEPYFDSLRERGRGGAFG